MQKKSLVITITVTVCMCLGFYGISYTANTDKKKVQDKKAKVEGKAQELDAGSNIVGSNHPEIPEGITCNDCHEIKLDAKTTATQLWLSGDYASFTANQGIMPTERVKEEIIKVMGGKKQNKTCVLATCLNNTPLSTTAEFALDETKMVLHGVHEKGTQKLLHIQQNPRVSINWHKEFTGFADTLCIQFIGHARIIDGTSPEYDRILMECTPTEERAKAMNVEPKKYLEMLKARMVISAITIEEATITNAKFRQEQFRPWQRWERKLQGGF